MKEAWLVDGVGGIGVGAKSCDPAAAGCAEPPTGSVLRSDCGVARIPPEAGGEPGADVGELVEPVVIGIAIVCGRKLMAGAGGAGGGGTDMPEAGVFAT